jgi:hypothetical protein
MRRILHLALAFLVLAAALAPALPVRADEQKPGDPFENAQRQIAETGQKLWRVGVTVLLVITALLFLVAAGGTLSGILTGSVRSLVWGAAGIFGAGTVLLLLGGIIGGFISQGAQSLAQPPTFIPPK